MDPSPQQVCACGNPTETICFYADGDSHGVCARCGRVRLIELESGKVAQRMVCNRCWNDRGPR